MKKNLFSCSFLGSIIFMLPAVLCGCNGTGTFSEVKYTPLGMYFSPVSTYFQEDYIPDFVSYPNDLAKFGLRGAVKEVKTEPYTIHQFNEAGNLTYIGHWLDSQHRYGDSFALEYDDKDRIIQFYNVVTRGGSGASHQYTYDEQNRLIERKSENYTRIYQYTGEGKSNYAVSTNKNAKWMTDDNLFSVLWNEDGLTLDEYRGPEGYWHLNGKILMHLSAKNTVTELCKGYIKTFYPDEKHYAGKLDSIVVSYSFSYNENDDVSQCLIHNIEYPSGKIWDCQIDYFYEYDAQGNWISRKLYNSDLRRLLGDFAVIEKDENGKVFSADYRTIAYYDIAGKTQKTIQQDNVE